MNDYPRMLYRKGTEAVYDGLACDTRIVDDEQGEAGASGWSRSPIEAHKPAVPALAEEQPARPKLGVKAEGSAK